MKIAVNTRFLLKNKMAGLGHFTNETMKRITKNHPEHEFIFLFDRPFSDEFIYSDNIKPVVLFPPARHPILFIWWFEYSIAKYLKNNPVDVFISPDNFLSLTTNTPSVLVIHDLAFEHYPENIPWTYKLHYKYFMPKFAQKATRIVAVSNATKEDIVDAYKINKDKIDVIHLGANPAFTELDTYKKSEIRQKYTGGNEYFISVSTIEPRKNFVRLLQAFDNFKAKDEQNIKLLIVGSVGWQTKEIFNIYKNLNFKDDVIWFGYASNDTLSELINASLCLAFVSIFEGFGLPIIEANSCGCPVITSNVSSMPEVANDAAYYVDPFSINSITDAFYEIANDKDLRSNLVLKGRKNKNRFSWDKTAKVLWSVIEKTKKEI